MSDFKNFKKADLAKVAKKIGLPVRSKDTKQSLLEKIELFIEESPEKAKELIEMEDDDDSEAEIITLVEDEEDEDVEADADADADEDEDDKDYNAPPPVYLKEWVVDPLISAFESSYEKMLEFTDGVGITTLEHNENLRETFSKTVTLNYVEAASEAAFFLYCYVPLVAVKDNKSVHQLLKDNIPHLKSCSIPLPDVTALYDFSVLSIFSNWLVYAVGLPLLISYYINFTRRVVTIEDEDDEESVSFVVRLFKYDPFIFALSKVLIYFFIFKNGAFNSIATYKGIFHALKDLVFIQLGIYHTFATRLGNFPLVLGVANVAIGLYSQFEDY